VIPAISGAIGPLGLDEWSVPSLSSDPAASIGADPASSGGSQGSFANALTGAINSLEQTQATGTNAAQALATGQLSDPTQAITAVENASLAMDLASQIRTKLVDATNTIFQTQM
jgi:flagellar hook-basal body complex protein FliE